MDTQKELREHLLELLEGKSAHIALETVLREFPTDKINTRLENAPHTAWELLEHLRIAQWDIVEFSYNAKHVSPAFPDGCWHKSRTATGRRSFAKRCSLPTITLITLDKSRF